jgi:MFS family permease
MFVAPAAGRLTDRIGGKFILLTGLTLFASGMGWIVVIAQPTSAWYDFLAPQVLAGIGIGCTFAPLTTIAMREITPTLAGAAAGVFNTTRQVGTVIGTAGIGALLQNRLIAAFTSQIQQRAGNLPAAEQQAMLSGFQAAAKSGLSAGQAQHGSPLQTAIFTNGFVQGMKPAMLVPILLVFAGAALCLLISRRPSPPEGAPAAEAVAEETAAPATATVT